MKKKLTFKEEFIEKAEDLARSEACCHYGFEDVNGKRSYHFNDICYARFKSDVPIRKFRIFINQHLNENNRENTQDIIDYINHVVKVEFPDVFLNKRTFWEDGLAFNCNYNHQFLFFIATLLRMSWEQSRFIPIFKMFKERGFSFMESAIFAQFIKKDENQWSIYPYYEQHGVCDNRIAISCIKKINADIFDKTPLNKRSTSFMGLFERLEAIDKRTVSISDVLESCQTKKIGDGWNSYTALKDVEEVFIKLKEHTK